MASFPSRSAFLCLAACTVSSVAAVACTPPAPTTIAPTPLTGPEVALEWRLASGGDRAGTASPASSQIWGLSHDGDNGLLVLHPAALSLSDDGGATFRHVALPTATDFQGLENAAASGTTVLASKGTKLYVSTDRGATFRERTLPADPAVRTGLVLSGERVLMAGSGGVFTSDDGGETFQRAEGYGSRTPQAIFARKEKVAVLSEDALTLSFDGGRTWRETAAARAVAIEENGVYALREPPAGGRHLHRLQEDKLGGVTDTAVGAPLGAPAVSLTPPSLAAWGNAVIIADWDAATSSPRVQVSLDGGVTFEDREIPVDGEGYVREHVVAVAMPGGFAIARTGRLVPRDRDTTQLLFASRNEKRFTFRTADHAFGGSGGVHLAADGDTLLALGTDTLASSTDGGRTWALSSSTRDTLGLVGVDDDVLLTPAVQAVTTYASFSYVRRRGTWAPFESTPRAYQLVAVNGDLAVCDLEHGQLLLPGFETASGYLPVALPPGLTRCVGTKKGIFAMTGDSLAFVKAGTTTAVETRWDSLDARLGLVPSKSPLATIVHRPSADGDKWFLGIQGYVLSSPDGVTWTREAFLGDADPTKPMQLAVAGQALVTLAPKPAADGPHLGISHDGGRTWSPAFLPRPPVAGAARSGTLVGGADVLCVVSRDRSIPACADLRGGAL